MNDSSGTHEEDLELCQHYGGAMYHCSPKLVQRSHSVGIGAQMNSGLEFSATPKKSEA